MYGEGQLCRGEETVSALSSCLWGQHGERTRSSFSYDTSISNRNINIYTVRLGLIGEPQNCASPALQEQPAATLKDEPRCPFPAEAMEAAGSGCSAAPSRCARPAPHHGAQTPPPLASRMSGPASTVVSERSP